MVRSTGPDLALLLLCIIHHISLLLYLCARDRFQLLAHAYQQPAHDQQPRAEAQSLHNQMLHTCWQSISHSTTIKPR